MGRFIFGLTAVLFCLSTSAHAELDEVLNAAINRDGAKALQGGLCQNNPLLRELAGSIDGFAVYGGTTIKGFANAGCEMTFWKGRTADEPGASDLSKMRTQGFCIPGVSVSSTKASPLNGSVSLLFGCKADPANYSGYFVSGGVSGARVNLGVGERVFEDAAVFLGLAKRAQGSDGQSFDQMLSKFREARSEIRAANAKLLANPAAKIALGSLDFEVPTTEFGSAALSSVLGDILHQSDRFLDGTNRLIPQLEQLRDQIRAVEKMGAGPEKTRATRDAVVQSVAVQQTLDDLRLAFAPNVMSLSTATNLHGTQLKGEIQNAFRRGGIPQPSPSEQDQIFRKTALVRPPPLSLPSFPRLEEVVIGPGGTRVGSVWSGVPAENPRGVPSLLPNTTKSLFLAGGGTKLPEGTTKVSAQDLRRATDEFEHIANQAIQSVEAARGFSLITGDSAIDLERTGNAKLDRQVGAVQKSDYLSGCNSISLPIEGLVRDAAGSLPALLEASIAYAKMRAGRGGFQYRQRALAAEYQNAKGAFESKGRAILTNRRPYAEAGAGISYYRPMGDPGTITTPEPIRDLFTVLQDCAKAGPAKAQAPVADEDSYAHSGGGRDHRSPRSETPSDLHF